jgi:hypothetical protein
MPREVCQAQTVREVAPLLCKASTPLFDASSAGERRCCCARRHDAPSYSAHRTKGHTDAARRRAHSGPWYGPHCARCSAGGGSVRRFHPAGAHHRRRWRCVACAWRMADATPKPALFSAPEVVRNRYGWRSHPSARFKGPGIAGAGCREFLPIMSEPADGAFECANRFEHVIMERRVQP